jgi:WASH complex subunit CCDC53
VYKNTKYFLVKFLPGPHPVRIKSAIFKTDEGNKMDADGLPLIGMGIDLTKVEAIPSKRMLAFMNHFVTNTAAFLNRFACVCEDKLETFSVRMQRLETTMAILEAKLASIPGLENVTVSTTAQATPPTAAVDHQPAAGPSYTPVAAEIVPSVSNGTVSTEPSATEEVKPNAVEIDPSYARYFQMIKMGVPLPAIRQKIIMEGLDPNVLENPSVASVPAPSTTSHAPSPAATAAAKKANNSDSDFSTDNEQSNSSSDQESSGFED